jgi:apolipoprotein N-acyltransferase
MSAIDRTPRLPTFRAWTVAPAFAGGLLVALSLPPWGWWPLAVVGIALLAHVVAGLALRRRLLVGLAFGLGQFIPGLWWMFEFSPGAGLVMLLETAFIVGALAVVPPTRPLNYVAVPAALVAAEALRGHIPFGGLPMAGVALGQVAGPLGGAARLGGALLVLAAAACIGAALAAAVRRHLATAAVLAAITVATALAGALAPDGGSAKTTLDVAVVQGGGRRGFRAVDSDPRQVFEAHIEASGRIRPPVDLVLWPEDVIDIAQPITVAPEAVEVGAVAAAVRAPVVAGVVEDDGDERFRNAAVLWSPDGRIVDRYDKVHRVPFGEYVPGRSFFDRIADLSVIPRDAIPGTGPGILRPATTPPLGVVISYEVYFADRARAAVDAGGQLLLVPTNAASFKTSQVPTTEVAAAQLRAIETGRDLAQSAPTGYGALVDNRGRVLGRTTLGRQEVLHGELHARTGRTIYTRVGDWPMWLAAAAALALVWRRVRRASS